MSFSFELMEDRVILQANDVEKMLYTKCVEVLRVRLGDFAARLCDEFLGVRLAKKLRAVGFHMHS